MKTIILSVSMMGLSSLASFGFENETSKCCKPKAEACCQQEKSCCDDKGDCKDKACCTDSSCAECQKACATTSCCK